jgi:hypothetical protein
LSRLLNQLTELRKTSPLSCCSNHPLVLKLEFPITISRDSVFLLSVFAAFCGEGETDPVGETEGEGETLGLAVADAVGVDEAVGESLGEALGFAVADAVGVGEAVGEPLRAGLAVADVVGVGEAVGEPLGEGEGDAPGVVAWGIGVGDPDGG